MEVYLINKDTNETINIYKNVLAWASNFVEYLNNGNRAKIYIDDNSYFSDKEII